MLLPSLAECAAMLERLAPDLAIAAAGSAIVIAIVAARVATLRRASASARHSAWAMGFGGVLLLPVLSAALPGWHVLPRPRFSRPGVLAPVPAVASFQIVAPSQPVQPAPARAGTKPETLMESQYNPVTASIETVVAPIDSKAIANAPQLNAPIMTPRFPSAPALKLSWTGWLVLCWAIGGFIAAGRLLLGHLSLWLLRRRCIAISHGECFGEMSRLKQEMGISRPVELLSTPLRAIPMTWGLWKARVVLPEEAAEWKARQRRDALLHELAHVKRRDCLTQRLSQIACALNWFNPLAWFAARRMEIERERACDDMVLSRGADAPSYARHLLQSIAAAGQPAFHLAGAAVAMGRPSTLEERLTAILDPSRSRRAPTAGGHLAMIVLLLATIAPVAVLRAQQVPDTSRQPANRVTTPNSDPNDNTTEPPTTRPANLAARGGGSARGRSAGGFGGFSGPGSFGGSRSLSAPGGAFPVLGQGPTCTLDATIYEVHISIDQIGRLDIAALNNAAETADGFEKALGALGTARPLYRADQSVRLAGDRLSIGANSPYVQATHTGASGQNVNTIGYMATGANFSLAGAVAASGNLDVDLNIQISSASPSGVLIGETTDALVIHTATLAHKGPVQGNKPFIVLSIDAGTLDKDGKALAYITRVLLGNPQQPAAK